MPASPFLDPFADIDRHGSDLPHWQQGAALCFVTWRLADSLPQAVLDELESQRAAWLAAHVPQPGAGAPSPLTAEYHRLFTAKEEAALDASHGSCLLRDPQYANHVEATLLHDDDIKYELIAFTVMPNHVHVLFSLRPGTSLDQTVQSWKSVSAHAINRQEKRSGPLWQPGYWDRLIRNREHFNNVRAYILDNPVRAHLPASEHRTSELRSVSDSGDLIRAGGEGAPAPMLAHAPLLACVPAGSRGAPAPDALHEGARLCDASGSRGAPAPDALHAGASPCDAAGAGAPPTLASLPTPSFVVDAAAIERNLGILAEVKRRTGCRILLALKAFSMFSVFPQMRRVLDGCCASSVHEARLGREAFGGEIHAFAAAFSEIEMRELVGLVDHVTLNSFAQWRQFQLVLRSHSDLRPPAADLRSCGLRINPEHSEGHTELYDPCAPGSRLGIRRSAFDGETLDGLTGLHCHNLCEQGSEPFARTVAAIEEKFGDLLPRLSWMNFGGGHHITRSDYNIDLLCDTLNGFRQRHPNIETIYLEPGEACALNAGTLVATVLDVVENGMPIAILDASCACHMPDVMEMPYRPRVFRDDAWQGEAVPGPQADRGGEPGDKPYTVRLAGASCLAGDIIGDWSFDTPLKPGDRVIFEDMAHYTMVKTNTFNGIRLPHIALRERDGAVRLVRSFGYDDFKSRLS